tara:strand:+ start:1704 stop:2171 length:468 start_codon:yes stop_codon:yes gene_type:complete
MKGQPAIIDKLNELLTCELTTIDVYFAQSHIIRDMGYNVLADHFKHEMEDEQLHATKIIERLIFLQGTPEMIKRESISLGKTIKDMLVTDLKYEHKVKDILVETIELCYEHKDFATKEVLEQLLIDTEEDHIDWLETQLSIIEEVGIENYLAEKL